MLSNSKSIARLEQGLATSENRTGSLARAARVLDVVAAGGKDGVLPSNITRETGLPRPTVYRVIQMLEELDWLERIEGRREVFLGPSLALLGLSALTRHSIEAITGDILDDLCHKIGQTIYLSVRSGDDAICVARVESEERIRTLVLEVGARQPLGYGAGSMALLASQPEEEIPVLVERNLSRLHANPNFDEGAFHSALSLARAEKHASHQGLFSHGVSGIGIAVCDKSGQSVAAISTAFITGLLTGEQVVRCRRAIEEAALQITERLARKTTNS